MESSEEKHIVYEVYDVLDNTMPTPEERDKKVREIDFRTKDLQICINRRTKLLIGLWLAKYIIKPNIQIVEEYSEEEEEEGERMVESSPSHAILAPVIEEKAESKALFYVITFLILLAVGAFTLLKKIEQRNFVY